MKSGFWGLDEILTIGLDAVMRHCSIMKRSTGKLMTVISGVAMEVA